MQWIVAVFEVDRKIVGQRLPSGGVIANHFDMFRAMCSGGGAYSACVAGAI